MQDICLKTKELSGFKRGAGLRGVFQCDPLPMRSGDPAGTAAGEPQSGRNQRGLWELRADGRLGALMKRIRCPAAARGGPAPHRSDQPHSSQCSLVDKVFPLRTRVDLFPSFHAVGRACPTAWGGGGGGVDSAAST